MTSAPSPKPGQLNPIIVGDTCRGFLYRGEFESFTIDEKSVGTSVTSAKRLPPF